MEINFNTSCIALLSFLVSIVGMYITNYFFKPLICNGYAINKNTRTIFIRKVFSREAFLAKYGIVNPENMLPTLLPTIAREQYLNIPLASGEKILVEIPLCRGSKFYKSKSLVKQCLFSFNKYDIYLLVDTEHK